MVSTGVLEEMSDLQEKIVNKVGLEFGWNASESSLKEFADEIIALVREHDLKKWKLHEDGVKLIKAYERKRCIDIARKVKDETGFVIYGDGSQKAAFNAGAAAVERALEKQE